MTQHSLEEGGEEDGIYKQISAQNTEYFAYSENNSPYKIEMYRYIRIRKYHLFQGSSYQPIAYGPFLKGK